jgi:hypothetical protein
LHGTIILSGKHTGAVILSEVWGAFAQTQPKDLLSASTGNARPFSGLLHVDTA